MLFAIVMGVAPSVVAEPRNQIVAEPRNQIVAEPRNQIVAEPSALAPAEAHALEPAKSATGTVAAGQAADFEVVVHEGDFVQGRVESPAGAIALDLVGDTGAHIRRLASPGASDQDFMFVPATQGTARLRLSAEGAAQPYTLTITRILARAAQVPPAPSYLSPRIAKLAQQVAAGGGTGEFWTSIAAEGAPMVEPASDPRKRIVTFLWRGAEHNVRLFGGPSNDHDWMDRLGTSDVWFKTYEIPSSTRLAYKLAPDIPELPGSARERRRALLATAQADPLNKARPWPPNAGDPFNRESVLTLPDAPPEPWIEERGAPKGALTQHRFASAILGNERDVALYFSHGFEPGNPVHALLVLFDAAPYLEKVPTPTILDNLVAAGKIPPLLAVMVGNPSSETRGRELPCNADFGRALATELLPWVRTQTKKSAQAARTVVAGSSYGGLASACIARDHPDVFGNVLSLSGSFWWHPDFERGGEEPEWLTRQYAAEPARPIRFFLGAGLFETGREQPGILETTRHLRDVLIAKGYDVTHREYAATHDYLAWRSSLADGLIALLGRDGGAKADPH
ncbi:enterochelin esterase [Hyphomicrobium sp. LHD-15]|uniref:enterochelin esterase n=1 Tax=Hyphomicrobium sp. LHD-15 TaxID=3072142 RepID=UPI00280C5799|nr:enterochelin esterase [Hyphomicrobium sp. LHD-15]MDQ8697602.1 enterochelin esterase [Hyphomicrobium sp. LHD-15]